MITIVASSKLTPTPELTAILAGLASTGETLSIRTSGSGAFTSPTEELVAHIANAVGRSIVRWQPSDGRHAFQRDYQMVERSSMVVAFFVSGDEMTGGTGHVVKAALDRDIPVEAYALWPDGEITLLGSAGYTIGSSPGYLKQLEELNVQNG